MEPLWLRITINFLWMFHVRLQLTALLWSILITLLSTCSVSVLIYREILITKTVMIIIIYFVWLLMFVNRSNAEGNDHNRPTITGQQVHDWWKLDSDRDVHGWWLPHTDHRLEWPNDWYRSSPAIGWPGYQHDWAWSRLGWIWTPVVVFRNQ